MLHLRVRIRPQIIPICCWLGQKKEDGVSGTWPKDQERQLGETNGGEQAALTKWIQGTEEIGAKILLNVGAPAYSC